MEGIGKGIARKIIIAGVSSSSGKTFVSCGLLEAFRERGFRICAYKTGPDYIDTEYLRRSGNCEAYNLDTWLNDENLTRELFINTSNGKDIAVIEGAMGLYDGGIHSTAQISKLLKAPVILVINAKSLGESVSAIVLGFREYDKDVKIAGVILNFVGSENHEKIISESLENLNVKILGVIKRSKNFSIPERHLGLLPFNENKNFKLKFNLENFVDVDEILKISESENLKSNVKTFTPSKKLNVKVGIAKDEAFTFYYSESLEILKNYGAELKFFSPIHDKTIPDCDCYIFGGGFPEMFAKELSENLSMIESVKNCEKKILAECGGMMYLCRSIENLNGEKFNMAGLIPFDSYMTDKPVIGYIEAKALTENILCNEGKIIRGHEFHYSRISGENKFPAFEFKRRRTGEIYYGGYSDGKILASYLHINFYGNFREAEKFLCII